ncbi:ABC transporter ATP-binding protein [Microbacterium sp. 1P10UB]|uniref:ABC transporter ATP-binding protein n=1 Tax=unclassified Microbacterium TaxID=2609290 RepID=UPI001371FCF7|nr:ABC transporter ATP-binding protein [Microbacterium sp. TL13]MXS75400.1 ABC transporter ATP-binding protein [Microbacterium sp. TL13]
MRIDVTNLSYTIGAQTILDGVTLSIDDGSRAAIVGPSGSGKSSLIRVIAGLASPSGGTVSLGGRIVSGAQSVPAHRRGVAYVPQDGALFPHLNAAANITFGLPRARRHTAQEWAEIVSLDPLLLTRYPHELSGGQQQRVALARALAVKARAIVLDEPFSALDTGLRAEARRNVVEALDRVGATAILVTHDQEEALSFGDRLGVLEKGSLTQFGPPLELFDYPRTARVAAMLGAMVRLPATTDGSTAMTAFGSVSLRHAPGTPASAPGQVSLLLREGQLVLGRGTPNALVTHVEGEGQWDRVTLLPDRGDDAAVTARLLRRPGSVLVAGSEVCIGIDGTGYIQPADQDAL